jgi:hypothetical protein
MKNVVVIDASLAAMWAIPERHTQQALAVAERWVETGSACSRRVCCLQR